MKKRLICKIFFFNFNNFFLFRAQFLGNFKESLQLIKNFMNLYLTKLNKLEETLNKFLDMKIDLTQLYILCIIKDKNNEDKITKYNTINDTKEKIKIDLLNGEFYDFNLEEHFESLFINDDMEYSK